MTNSPENTPPAESQLDRSAPATDNTAAQSSQIWSSSLENWNKSDKQMSPWKNEDVDNKGFSSSSKLLGNLYKDESTPGSGDALDMSVPAGDQKLDMQKLGLAQDGKLNKDGQPRKEGEQAAQDDPATKDGDPSMQRIKKNASQSGEQEKVNAAQNGVEAIGPKEKKNAAQNGVEATAPKEGDVAKEGDVPQDGDPSMQRIKKNASQNGEQEKKNVAQNGIESTAPKEHKNAAQNGLEAKPPTEPKVEGEEQKKEQTDPKKEAQPESEEQRKAEEQKMLEGAMFDKNLSSEQKLSAARELVKRGVTNVNGVDESGAKSSLRLESIPAGGDREMVHVFNTKEGGNEKTALRGISNEDGSWEQQKDKRGRSVSYEGKGAADLNTLRPEGTDAQPKPDARPDGTRPDGTRPDGTRPDATRPDATRPDANPDGTKPDGKVEQKTDEKKDVAPENIEKKTDQAPDADPKAKLNQMFDDAKKQADGKVGKMVKTDQGVYLKSDFDVDLDGSPRAKQLDRYGSTETSMIYKNGRSVNAEEVPYIVLQKDKYAAMGVKLGDMALVRDTKTGNIAAAVFADAGPNNKTGEGSINLGKEGLGLKGIGPNNGVEEKRFEYLVKPGTNGGSRPRNQAEMLQRIDNFKREMGLIK